jgi:hypothetical protein
VYARAVDQADARLRELRQEERGEVLLGTLALAAAIVATEVRPALAAPLFIGGVVLVLLGGRTMWRRWDLLDRLSGERDAYVISEVRAFAAREATIERRRTFAALLRGRLREATAFGDARVLAVRADLAALAEELENDALTLEPASAVACTRLLSDVAESALLNCAFASEDLRSRVLQVRAGFSPQAR